MLLKGRNALITGAAGRLGRAIAVAMQREGAGVALSDRSGAALDGALASLQVGPAKACSVAADVTNPAEIAGMMAAAEAQLGPVDILVAGAGIFPNSPLLDMELDEWDRVFDVNVRGMMLCCQAAARHWVAHSTPGAIVTLSSGASRSARPGGSHYCASKAAVNMMTQVWAAELGRHGIRVNAVLPGLVMDEVVREQTPDQHPYINAMLAATPLGRTGDPADIAEAVVFLASDRSSWTTGATLDVGGGTNCGRTQAPLTRDLHLYK